jgi:hypothetical protein
MSHKVLKSIHFLLFLYLFSSYLSATHIHNNSHTSQDNCQVCLVVKNLHSADAPTIDTLPVFKNIQTEETHYIQTIVLSTPYKGFDAHAPPLYS